jgi:hypothetical protein
MTAQPATREDITEHMPLHLRVYVIAHGCGHPHDTTICQYDELTCPKDFKVPEIWRHTAERLQFAKVAPILMRALTLWRYL